MRGVGGFVARGLFYLVAAVLVAWTSSLTVAFVQGALPASFWLVPYLALVVFDLGQLAWLLVFLHAAQGTGQRGVALSVCLVDFAGVGLMVLSEILLGGQQLTAAPEQLGTFAVWGIGGWTVINMGAVILYHLLDPETRREMAIRVEYDAVFDEGMQRLQGMRAAQGGALAEQLAAEMMAELRGRLKAGQGTGAAAGLALTAGAEPGSNGSEPLLAREPLLAAKGPDLERLAAPGRDRVSRFHSENGFTG